MNNMVHVKNQVVGSQPHHYGINCHQAAKFNKFPTKTSFGRAKFFGHVKLVPDGTSRVLSIDKSLLDWPGSSRVANHIIDYGINFVIRLPNLTSFQLKQVLADPSFGHVKLVPSGTP